MTKSIFVAIALMASTAVLAQTDPVIMKIAGVPVTRSEFEYSYNKNNTDGVIDKKTVEEYVELFVNYKLKVQAALDARIDTSSAYRAEFAQYRDQQVVPTFATDADMDREARTVYDRTVTQIGPDGLIKPAHILILLKQTATDEEQKTARQRIDSIYAALQGGADFEELARKVSQDPGTAPRGGVLGWCQRNQLVKEFEDAAFALKAGEMSKPVQSPFGWHIILMKERKQMEPFDFHRESILRFLEQRGARESVSERLVNERVAQSNGTLTREQLLQARADSLSAVDLEMRYLIKEYHDGLLLYEISNRTVWEAAAKNDKALQAFFKKNRKRYKMLWQEPRFKGIAYHVQDPADVKAVVRCIKKLKFDEWNEALRSTFNADSVIRIRAEKGIFKKGDNPLIDREQFGVADAKVDSVKGYPIDATYGKLLKQPEDFTDVRAEVTADLQEELERNWVADLRRRYTVEVYEDVLQTVNKHD